MNETTVTPLVEAPEPTPVEALAHRFWEGFLERHPTLADRYGDERWSDRLEDPGPAGRDADTAALRDLQAATEAIDPAGLSVEDEITRDMLATLARIWTRADEQGIYQLDAVDAMGGPQILPGNLARIQRVGSPDRFAALLARLAAFPAYMAAYEDILRDGQASGVGSSRVDLQACKLEYSIVSPK